MKPIKNWENVKAPAKGFETLPSGAYICDIKRVEEKPNKNNGGSHLEIWFDVCEGEYKDFFAKDYKAQTREDKFWRGSVNQNIPDETSPKYEQQAGFFRRFTDTIEASNPGYVWAWDEKSLVGKKCGIIFGEREKQSQKGTVYTVTYADEIIPVEAVRSGDYSIPLPKKLTTAYSYSEPAFSGYSDGDLPF